jgi:hypothetical protein
VADVDLGANALRNVEPLVPGSENGGAVSHASFSGDGRYTGIVTRPGPEIRFVLSVRSEATREIREYPLPIRVDYTWAPKFSRDGNTVALSAEIFGGLVPPRNGWNAIIRVDLLTGRMEIDEVVHTHFVGLLPDGRSALIARNDRPAVTPMSQSFVRNYSIRDLARHTERALFHMENDRWGGLTPDGQSMLSLPASHPGGPREGFLIPLDGSSGPRPISDAPLPLPAGGEVRFDPSGGALIAIFEEAERTYTGVFTRHSIEALTWERIPLDGSPRTSTTVRFPNEFPAIDVLPSGGLPTVSPRADRILYVTGGAPAYELWVLEGLPGGVPTRAGDR